MALLLLNRLRRLVREPSLLAQSLFKTPNDMTSEAHRLASTHPQHSAEDATAELGNATEGPRRQTASSSRRDRSPCVSDPGGALGAQKSRSRRKCWHKPGTHAMGSLSAQGIARCRKRSKARYLAMVGRIPSTRTTRVADPDSSSNPEKGLGLVCSRSQAGAAPIVFRARRDRAAGVSGSSSQGFSMTPNPCE